MPLVLEDVARALLCLSSQLAQWRRMKRGMFSVPLFHHGQRQPMLSSGRESRNPGGQPQEAMLTRFSVDTGPLLGQDIELDTTGFSLETRKNWLLRVSPWDTPR